MLSEANTFLDRIFEHLERTGVNMAGSELDHVCYRVETTAEYGVMKHKLATQARLVYEALIGGRAIATYELHQPIRYERAGEVRTISYLELPSPKPGSSYASGFEHVEFVINESFESFMARYPHLTFDTSGTHKKVNAELRLSFKDCSVKFHHQSLKDVIAFETSGS